MNSQTVSAASVQRLVLAVVDFRAFLVLVLSIAVLVLVPERVFGNRLTALDQASQHGYDPLQFGFAMDIAFPFDRIANAKHIMDRSAF